MYEAFGKGIVLNQFTSCFKTNIYCAYKYKINIFILVKDTKLLSFGNHRNNWFWQKSWMDTKVNGSKFSEEIFTQLQREKNCNLIVEKPGRHLIQVIKVISSNETCWHYMPPEMMHWEGISSLLFLSKMGNLNLVMRKHQTQIKG